MLNPVTHDNDEFYMELGQLSEEHTLFLAKSFENLPANPYKDGAYRLRRFSHFTFAKDQLKHLPTKAFNQSEKYNQFQGGIMRQYPEIEAHVIANPAFKEMFHHFKDMAHVDDAADIDVHQIRIIAKPGQKTPVAPEGIHQDGFDRIGIFIIDREHICGGEINVYISRDQQPFVHHCFDHGEFVILNDKRFWHGAATIEATESAEAHMDVFVLTANLKH